MARKIALLSLLIVSIVFLGAQCCNEQCCVDEFPCAGCTEQWCADNHPSTECSMEWCISNHPVQQITPTPPGPDITLEEDPDDPNGTRWVKNGTTELMTADQLVPLPDPPPQPISVFPPNYPTFPCTLRRDFIGLKAEIFDFYTDPALSSLEATKVEAESDDYKITIERGLWNTLLWTIKEKTGQQRVCRPIPVTGFQDWEIPKELAGLKLASLTDTPQGGSSEPVKKILIRAELP